MYLNINISISTSVSISIPTSIHTCTKERPCEERARRQPSPGRKRGLIRTTFAGPLPMHFQPPNCWENKFLLFRLLSLCYFVNSRTSRRIQVVLVQALPQHTQRFFYILFKDCNACFGEFLMKIIIPPCLIVTWYIVISQNSYNISLKTVSFHLVKISLICGIPFCFFIPQIFDLQDSINQ